MDKSGGTGSPWRRTLLLLPTCALALLFWSVFHNSPSTLVVYAHSDGKDATLLHFLMSGVFESKDVAFVVVGPVPVDYPDVTYVATPDAPAARLAWEVALGAGYDRYVFVDSSLAGPYAEPNMDWTAAFTADLSETVLLVSSEVFAVSSTAGAEVSIEPRAFAVNQEGFDALLASDWFTDAESWDAAGVSAVDAVTSRHGLVSAVALGVNYNSESSAPQRFASPAESIFYRHHKKAISSPRLRVRSYYYNDAGAGSVIQEPIVAKAKEYNTEDYTLIIISAVVVFLLLCAGIIFYKKSHTNEAAFAVAIERYQKETKDDHFIVMESEDELDDLDEASEDLDEPTSEGSASAEPEESGETSAASEAYATSAASDDEESS